MENKKFFLYARKSTDVEDKQVLSIDAQLTELREYAVRENIEISAEIVEKQSAKVPGRPLFKQWSRRTHGELFLVWGCRPSGSGTRQGSAQEASNGVEPSGSEVESLIKKAEERSKKLAQNQS